PSVAYLHLILTETGTSFFIALLVTVALQKPESERAAWMQALLFGVVLAAGYYWRQLLLNLAPVAVALWLMRNWRFVHREDRFRFRSLGRVALALVILGVAPLVISHFWDPFTDRAGLAEISLRQGIIRQALFAPTDPVVGENKPAYINAVRESASTGNFISGVRNDLFDPLLDQLFRDRPMGTGDTRRVFVSAVLHYPSRYFAGVARTALLFMGAKATVNENRIFRAQILSPDWPGAKIGDGPSQIQERIKPEFQQITTSSALLQLLWRLCPLYDVLLVIA